MKFLDPGLRRDDDFEASSTKNVIPAQAGIHGLDSSGVRPSQK
jgi:hypothetical protein